jgi:hypothetical protein
VFPNFDPSSLRKFLQSVEIEVVAKETLPEPVDQKVMIGIHQPFETAEVLVGLFRMTKMFDLFFHRKLP